MSGTGSCTPSIASDPRVISMEGVNARHLDEHALPEPVDLVLVDASFISLTKLLPALVRLLAPHGRLLALVKPQFEVGPAGIGKRGVVSDDALRAQAFEQVKQAAEALGLVTPWTRGRRAWRGPKETARSSCCLRPHRVSPRSR